MADCDAAVCTSAATAKRERTRSSGRAYRNVVIRRLYETWRAEVKRVLLDGRDEAVALLRLDVLDRHAGLLVLARREDEEADARLARGDRLVAEDLAPDALPGG